MELPIFPLNTVLFPGATLPLHIFEERYKVMIRRCIDDRTPFGVCLIRRGMEVGGAAEPFAVGTTALIQHVEALDEGRMNILCVGGERFRIVRKKDDTPFLLAETEPVADEQVDPHAAVDLVESVSRLFVEYVRLNLAISNQWARSVEVPAEAGALSDYVAGRLGVDVLVRQRLLEERSVEMRLAVERGILEGVVRSMSRRVEVHRGSRLRGFAQN